MIVQTMIVGFFGSLQRDLQWSRMKRQALEMQFKLLSTTWIDWCYGRAQRFKDPLNGSRCEHESDGILHSWCQIDAVGWLIHERILRTIYWTLGLACFPSKFLRCSYRVRVLWQRRLFLTTMKNDSGNELIAYRRLSIIENSMIDDRYDS